MVVLYAFITCVGVVLSYDWSFHLLEQHVILKYLYFSQLLPTLQNQPSLY